MKQLTKQSRLFTLIGIIASIIGYLFLLYQGYNLNNEIIERKSEINQLEELRIEKIKHLSEIENRLIQITSSSRDSLTVRQGEDLAKEFGIPTGKHFKETTPEETNLENAKKFEEMGFQYLLERNIDKSIESFIQSENSYNGYHSVFEIARFLERNKAKLSDKESDLWNDTYQTLLSKYSWKMPEDYKTKLQEQVK